MSAPDPTTVALTLQATAALGKEAEPRRPPENRPYVATSKPANEAEPGQEYFYNSPRVVVANIFSLSSPESL